MLEREANFAEAKHFTEIFTNYLENGYGGAARVPQQMIAVQLQPFVCEIWWAQMIQLEIKKKNLKEAMEVVMPIASENNPVEVGYCNAGKGEGRLIISQDADQGY